MLWRLLKALAEEVQGPARKVLEQSANHASMLRAQGEVKAMEKFRDLIDTIVDKALQERDGEG